MTTYMIPQVEIEMFTGPLSQPSHRQQLTGLPNRGLGRVGRGFHIIS